MIIGLSGFAESGKDTVANFIVEEFGFEHRKFAEPLKKSVAELFAVSREDVDNFKSWGKDGLPDVEVIVQIKNRIEYCFSWREILQRYGTEAHRNVFGEDFWVDKTLPFSDMAHNIVISDCRFKNELGRVRNMGGTNIRVVRDEVIVSNDTHVSEQYYPRLTDYWLFSTTGDLDGLREVTINLVKGIMDGSIGDTLSLSDVPRRPSTPPPDSDAGASSTAPQG